MGSEGCRFPTSVIKRNAFLGHGADMPEAVGAGDEEIGEGGVARGIGGIGGLRNPFGLG